MLKTVVALIFLLIVNSVSSNNSHSNNNNNNNSSSNGRILDVISPSEFRTIKLLEPSNWQPFFAISSSGGYPPTVSGTDTAVVMEVTGNTHGSRYNINRVFMNYPVLNYQSFNLSFQLKIVPGPSFGDFFAIIFGRDGVHPSSGYMIIFNFACCLFHGDNLSMKILLLRENVIVASSQLPSLSSEYASVQVTYTMSKVAKVATLNIYYEDILVLSYNDFNIGALIQASNMSSDSYWGFQSDTGGATFSAFLMSVDMELSQSQPSSSPTVSQTLLPSKSKAKSNNKRVKKVIHHRHRHHYYYYRHYHHHYHH